MKTAVERARKIYEKEIRAAEKKYEDDPKALESQLKWLEENKFKASGDAPPLTFADASVPFSFL